MTLNNNIAIGYVACEVFSDGDTQRVSTQFVNQKVINDTLAYNYNDKSVVSLNNLFLPFAYKSGNTNAENTLPFIHLSGRISPDTRNLIPSGNSNTYYSSGNDYNATVNAENLLKHSYGSVLTVGSEQITHEEMVNGTSTNRVRSVGFALPMYGCGWGYDTSGRPVPSVYDELSLTNSGQILISLLNSSGNMSNLSYPSGLSPTASGEYYKTYVSGMISARKQLDDYKNTFVRDFNTNHKLAKVGPIDFRWNEGRNVYTCGPEELEGYLLTTLPASPGRLGSPNYGSGLMVVYNGVGSDWRKIEPEKLVWVINRSSNLEGVAGAYIQVRRLGNGEYRPIWVDCDMDPSGIPASYQSSLASGVL